MLSKSEPRIRVLVLDVDNTLVEVRAKHSGIILNASLLLPVLKFAANFIPLAIDTARDKRLDRDFSASAGVSVNDLLRFLKKEGIPFSKKDPDLIVMSEDVEAFRQGYMKQYQPGSDGWNIYVREKNPDLHMIMHRLNEVGKKDDKFQPLMPENILILDDSDSVVNQAQKAGFRAILVPLNFAPNATGTVGVDYLYQLAELVGLEDYAQGYALEPEKYSHEPEAVITSIKQYSAAKSHYSRNVPQPLRFVHPDLEMNLVELISTEPRNVYSTLKKFKDRRGYNRLVDAQRLIGTADLQSTLLGEAIKKDSFVIVSTLLALGASANQVFDLSLTNRAVTPLVAAILKDCHSEILYALLDGGATIERKSELALALNQFCRKPQEQVNADDYKRLDILVFSYQTHLGLDQYCQIISSFFLLVLKQKNPNLLPVLLKHLNAGHRQALFDLTLEDNELKLLSLTRPGRDDQFTKQFLLDFFFQIPLQNMKNIIGLPLKLSPRNLGEKGGLLSLCHLIQDAFLLEKSGVQLVIAKKRTSGSFFKTRKEDTINEATCFEKIEQLVLYFSYLENYYDLGKFEKTQATEIFAKAFIIVDMVKESRYCKSLVGDNKTAFVALCSFLDVSEVLLSPSLPVKRKASSPSPSRLNLFGNKSPKAETLEKVEPEPKHTMESTL